MNRMSAFKQHLRYRKWIKKNKTSIQDYSDHSQPLISVVMPTYNTNPFFLEQTIRSVLGQTYKHWELCIADDGSTNRFTLKILKRYLRHPQIKIKFNKSNQHISKATNLALEFASGDFIAFLDHDDLLAPHALAEVVHVINKHPLAKIIYSDEDKINSINLRKDPHFKPDYNYELLLAINYICHLCVIKKEVVHKIGGFRQGYEGSQDYDLLLRCLPLVKEEHIIHIPKILYHWRTSKNSVAKTTQNKNYATKAGLQSLNDYLISNKISAKVHPGILPTTYRVQYALPKSLPLVSLIIPTRDKSDLLKQCIESILQKTDYPHYEIIIVNNQSIEESTLRLFAYFKSLTRAIKVIDYDHPFNYSAMNNHVVQHHCEGELVGLLNNDLEIINTDWLTEMVSHASREGIGCVGAKLFYPNNTIQHAGIILGIGGVAGHGHKYYPSGAAGYFGRLLLTQYFSAVTGACLLVKKSIYTKVNGLNEEALKVAFNDVDFCLKVKKLGYNNLWTPYAKLYHHESASRGYENTPEKFARFLQERGYMLDTWKKELSIDPFYNPNLTRVKENFSCC